MHLEQRPTIKGRIHLDEKYIKVNKEDYYDLNAIDAKTKHVLAHLFVEKRTIRNCIRFLRQIKKTCYDQILEKYKLWKCKKGKCIIFVCDKFANYKNAFTKLFYHVAMLHFGVPIKAKKNGLQHNNNPIERYNQDIKDQIKTKRHFGSYEGAKEFLDLRHVIKNFVNPHQSLKGKTPAEAAEIKLSLGRDKLRNLIRYKAKSKMTKS